ncbi:hypothetical protein Bpro_5452 (plasmid) [Polaromonas sp. JS666]|nr:hypothetical protein Bpro_5452 [Polaromonas sp. JS666]
MPCTEKRARLLLARGRARVHRLVPLVIRLVDRQAAACDFQPLRIKLDPGSKTTGVALVRDVESVDASTGEIHSGVAVINLLDLVHRGRQISEALTARRQMRRRRRSNLRCRAPRFLNRGNKKSGWIAPSLQHRVDTAMAWVRRIQRWAPVRAISSELVRFDMQALQNPEISGVEYQQGTLFGYELREYLMRGKRVQGFGTGDMVRAEVPKGVKAGVHVGRVAVRASGSFNIQTHQGGISGVVQGISHKHCRVTQRNDGYGYFFNRADHTGREQVWPKASDAAHPALYLPAMNGRVSRAI